MVRFTVVDCTKLPLVPVIVIGYTPGAAVVATWKLTVAALLALMDAALKRTVTPLGCPAADSEMAELKPPEPDALTVSAPVAPTVTVRPLLVAASAKFAVVTLSVTVTTDGGRGAVEPLAALVPVKVIV
jgi:anti-sigma factor RsiW